MASKLRLRKALTSLWLVLIVSFGLRAGFAWKYAHARSHQALGVIPFLYEPGNIAYSLAQGRGFGSPFRVETGPTAWVAPVYPLILDGIFRVFGTNTFHSWVAAALANIFFLTAAGVPIFYSGKRIGGVALGATAAWLWALFPNAILIPVESMWDASLSALLAAVILWATLELGESGSMRNWCYYGLLWGFTLLTDPTLGSLLPFLLAWLCWKMHKRGCAWMGRTALAVGVMLLCCVPWTVRNYKVFHAFIPLRTGLGLQLWLGNNAESQGRWPGWQHPIDNEGERKLYVQMGEVAYMRVKREEATRYMFTHPKEEAEMTGDRFLAFWSGGTQNPVRDFVKYKSTWFRYVLLFDLLVGIGALSGCVMLVRKRSEFFVPLAIFPVIYPVAYYLTLSLPRYRLPADPVILLLTAYAALQVVEYFRRDEMSGRAIQKQR